MYARTPRRVRRRPLEQKDAVIVIYFFFFDGGSTFTWMQGEGEVFLFLKLICYVTKFYSLQYIYILKRKSVENDCFLSQQILFYFMSHPSSRDGHDVKGNLH